MEPKDTDNPMEDDGAGSEAPSSSNGRIPVIKIKIPKKVEDEEAAAEEAVKRHCCKECNKSFSSGKALGGHMSSAHVQANKDYSFKKLSSKRKTPGSGSGSNSGSDGGAIVIPCTLCPKSFNTKKSLFGHMRCHPERYWRGMVPPPETPQTADADADADASSEDGGDDGDGDGDDGEHDQIDSGLGFNLKGWALSNKRGRGPVAIRAPDEEKENESFVAGLQLIKMLKGECSARRKPEPEFKNSFQGGKGKEKVAENQDSESPTSGPRIDPSDELYNTAIQVLASVKMDTQKRAAEAEAEAASSSPEKYKCNVCGRMFPTHQALGGHRSSHNKFRMTIINTNSRSSPLIVKKKKNSNSNKKRKTSTDADTAAAGSSSSSAFAFDLNMPPEEEEEDVQGGGSSNHTSSSD